jgi:hypothetical protein
MSDIDLNVEDLASIRARLAEIRRSADDSPMQTREQWAAHEFEPVSPEIAKPFENPGWDQECSELGVVGRMAAVLLQNTKPELIAIARALVNSKDADAVDGFFELLESFRQFQTRLELWSWVLVSAELRLLIAASTIPPGDGGERAAEVGEAPDKAAA